MSGSTIVAVKARQIMSERGHPGVEATVITENGAKGVAVSTAGTSTGTHEVAFAYDGGEKWRGKGVTKAVASIHEKISPAIIGLDASNQLEVDSAMLAIGKSVLSGNATSAVSAAALKAGAASLGIPLYQHIGGEDACTLPVPGSMCLLGSDRYLKSPRAGGKPTLSFMAYDFETFSDASYALWDVSDRWAKYMRDKYGVGSGYAGSQIILGPGHTKSDEELWDAMTELIAKCGYEGKMGLQMDIASDTYFNAETQKFEGLFDSKPRDMDELMAYLAALPEKWPFVVIEDPLPEDDYEATARFTKMVDIQVVGDDLFTTNPERVLHGIKLGAANTVLLKVNQIGTITEAFEMANLAHSNGYGVMPCSSRGEGIDICDYCVGLKVGSVRESGINAPGNRFLEIEAELGSRAKFAGKSGLRGARFAVK